MSNLVKVVPIRRKDSDKTFTLIVPKGRTYDTMMSARSEFVVRCQAELRDCLSSAFVTLTYEDENLPYWNFSRVERRRELDRLKDAYPFYDMYGKFILNKTHARNFVKQLHERIKKYNPSFLVRYVLNGEYTPYSHRPHYHALLFFPIQLSHDAIESLVTSLWRYGHVDCGDVTDASINYLGKHCMKEDNGNSIQREVSPIFMLRCVHDGGIGRSLSDDPTVLTNYYNDSNFIHNGVYKVNIPRYVKKRINCDTYSDDELAEISARSLDNFKSRIYNDFGFSFKSLIEYLYGDYDYVVKTLSERQVYELIADYSNKRHSIENATQMREYFDNKFRNHMHELRESGYFNKNLQKKFCE